MATPAPVSPYALTRSGMPSPSKSPCASARGRPSSAAPADKPSCSGLIAIATPSRMLIHGAPRPAAVTGASVSDGAAEGAISSTPTAMTAVKPRAFIERSSCDVCRYRADDLACVYVQLDLVPIRVAHAEGRGRLAVGRQP